MNYRIFISLISGASLGALLRYNFSLKLNSIFPLIPFGTLTSNWLGSLIMGIMIYLSLYSTIFPKEITIGITSGFLGSLTTFSTFSAETFELLNKKAYFLVSMQILLHVLGSIAMVFIGFFLCKIFVYAIGEIRR